MDHWERGQWGENAQRGGGLPHANKRGVWRTESPSVMLPWGHLGGGATRQYREDSSYDDCANHCCHSPGAAQNKVFYNGGLPSPGVAFHTVGYYHSTSKRVHGSLNIMEKGAGHGAASIGSK